MDDRDDLSLLRAMAQERDRQAFEELFERHREHAYSFAYRILQDSALAQDAVQEAMLSIWLSTKPVLEDANARAWILRSVAGKSFDLGRNRKRRTNREDRMFKDSGRQSSAHEDNAEKGELIAALRKQIDELPEIDRQLLAFHFGADISQHKISEMLGIPQRTVSDKIQQTIGQLRGMLTRAGVAAVVPLVNAENLFEAMTTGQAYPPELTAKVLSKIAVKTIASISARSRRVAPKAASSLAPVGIAAAVVVGAVGIWFVTNVPSKAPSPPPAAPVTNQPRPVQPEAPPAEERLFKRWTFDAGPAKDLNVVRGSWQWKRPKENEPGFMDAGDEGADVVLPLEISPPARPLLVTIHYRNFKQGSFGVSSDWFAGGELAAQKVWSYGWFSAPYGERVNHSYFLGAHLANFHDTKVTAFEKRDFRPAHPPFLAALKPMSMAFFKEYARPNPATRIHVFLKNVEALEIVLQSLRPEEIPDLLRDPAGLEARLGEPNSK